jgi:hypothetical protein
MDDCTVVRLLAVEGRKAIEDQTFSQAMAEYEVSG